MSAKLPRKTQEKFVYTGFGFPVELRGKVPMMQFRGVWILDLDLAELTDRVVDILARKDTRLTGNQVRFIRQSLGLTLQAFGDRLGVSHAAVMKWEASADRPAPMKWAVELVLRLLLLRRGRLDGAKFLKAFDLLSSARPSGPQVPPAVELGAMTNAGNKGRRSELRK